jgi:hypothetical protein
MRRVLIVLGIGFGVIAASVWFLRPNVADESDLRYMHCNVCKMEMVYNKQLAGGNCPHCQPPKIGKMVPTHDSLVEGGGDPWRPVKMAMSFEMMALLGAVVFLLYNPPKLKEPGFRRMRCPRCKRRLRFAEERAGGEGQCPGCKAVIGFPLFSDESAA